jgi:acetylglutamate kinase
VKGEDGAVLRSLRRRDIERLRERGVISGGMLPKTASCLEALERDVGAVYIAPGASQQVLLRVAAGTYDEGSVIHGDERGHRDKAE